MAYAPAGRSSRRLLTGPRIYGAAIVLVVLGLLVTPRVLEARTAFAWTSWHVTQGKLLAHASEHVRQAGHWAGRTIDLCAPLPWAAESAQRALAFGLTTQDKDRVASLSLYTEVRAALDRALASRWRGLGLEALATEARRLEEEAREKKR
jgi:hypothetical protein